MVTSSPSEKPLPPCEISNDVSEIDFPCITIHNETIYAAPTPNPIKDPTPKPTNNPTPNPVKATSPPVVTEVESPTNVVVPCELSNDEGVNSCPKSPTEVPTLKSPPV